MPNTIHHPLEHVAQLVRVLAFFSLAVLPATWVSLRRCTHLSMIGRLALGLAAGFSLFVVGTWYVGLWSLDYVVIFWLVELAVAIWLGRRSDRAASGRRGTTPGTQFGSSLKWTCLTILPLLAAALLQLNALHFSKLPLGVDPAFHCVVAQRQLDAGRVTLDLWPLEELRVNYPVGCHLWLAVAARWTGLEVHEVFRHSFTLSLCGAGLLVAACAQRLFGTARHAAAASLAFVFASYQASFYPYTWGGLPSAVSMWLALGALYVLFVLTGRSAVLLGSVLFAATGMTHPHTLVAVFGGVGVTAVVAYGCGLATRKLLVQTALSLMGGTLIAGIYAASLARRLGEIRETGVVTFADPFAWPWEHLWSWGPCLLVLAAIGIAASVRADSRECRNFLLVLAATWGFVFLAFDYAGRAVTRSLLGRESTPLAPSRFLFDVQFLLAIFAGGGLVWLLERLRNRAAICVALVGLVGWSIWQCQARWEPTEADRLLPLGAWIRTNLPPDSLLVTGPGNVWATYVCNRESTSLFLPISEHLAPDRRRLKESLVNKPDSASAQQWRKQLGKSIYVISFATDDSWGEPLHVASGLAIFPLWPPAAEPPGDRGGGIDERPSSRDDARHKNSKGAETDE